MWYFDRHTKESFFSEGCLQVTNELPENFKFQQNVRFIIAFIGNFN